MKLSDIKKKAATNVPVWFEYDQGVRLCVAPAGGKEYDEYLAKRAAKLNPVQRRLMASTPELANDIDYRAAAEILLVDWEGITDEKGKEMAYTPADGYAFFKECYQFYKDVTVFSVLARDGADSFEAEVLGNSKSE